MLASLSFRTERGECQPHQIHRLVLVLKRTEALNHTRQLELKRFGVGSRQLGEV